MMHAEIYINHSPFGMLVHCDIYRPVDDQVLRSSIVRPFAQFVNTSNSIGIWIMISMMIGDAMWEYQKHDREMVDSFVTEIESIGGEIHESP